MGAEDAEDTEVSVRFVMGILLSWSWRCRRMQCQWQQVVCAVPSGGQGQVWL